MKLFIVLSNTVKQGSSSFLMFFFSKVLVLQNHKHNFMQVKYQTRDKLTQYNFIISSLWTVGEKQSIGTHGEYMQTPHKKSPGLIYP